MNPIKTLADTILGKRVANSETRHRPRWLPKYFDKRWWGERFAVMDIPPYKPPYRRYAKYKAWVCMGPNYCLSKNVIVEIDLDEREFNVDLY